MGLGWGFCFYFCQTEEKDCARRISDLIDLVSLFYRHLCFVRSLILRVLPTSPFRVLVVARIMFYACLGIGVSTLGRVF